MRLANVVRVAVVAVVFMAVGCSSNKGKIEGTKWTNRAATIKGNSIPPGVITLEFKADHSLVFIAGPEQYRGTYTLGAGDNVTFNTDRPISGNNKNLEKITISGNTLTMTDRDGTVMFDKLN